MKASNRKPAPNPLQQRLRTVRKRAKLTQTELANAIGVSQPYVSAIERGLRVPMADVLLDWLRACGHELEFRSTSGLPEEPEDTLLTRMTTLIPRMSPTARRMLDSYVDVLAEASHVSEPLIQWAEDPDSGNGPAVTSRRRKK